jgi:glycine/D-amino acid oxidase-like deaminating enzyme
MVDYLIIGSGLAGISFAETALLNNKNIFVVDCGQNSSSKVAAGLYNPVILKRFTPVWDAQNQLQLLDGFYKNLEAKLHQQFDFKKPILRKFFSIEEQNNWFIASDKIELSPFLATQLRKIKFNGIDSPYDYGEVNHTGYVEVTSLLEHYKSYLQSQNSYRIENFDYNLLEIRNGYIHYKEIIAKQIIFAEGFGMHQNPFFNDLPLDGVKGELLIIKAPELSLDLIINTSVFILPLGNQLFKVGATYNWNDKTDTPTQEGKQELIDRIKEILSCNFEIISHYAGVRPTVKDRKPLVGTHPDFKNVHILNGLGTRGVMLGPSMAKELFEHIEFSTPLTPEININRFYKKK